MSFTWRIQKVFILTPIRFAHVIFIYLINLHGPDVNCVYPLIRFFQVRDMCLAMQGSLYQTILNMIFSVTNSNCLAQY
jgi:hypothetical protein